MEEYVEEKYDELVDGQREESGMGESEMRTDTEENGGSSSLLKHFQSMQEENALLEGGNCPICLQGLSQTILISTCLHAFCFECIQAWAQNLYLHGESHSTCPLCKSPFDDILTHIISEEDYQVQSIRSKYTCNEEELALQLRRMVYRSRMILKSIDQTPCDPTTLPKLLKSESELLPWIKRELHAYFGLDEHSAMLIYQLLLSGMKKQPSIDTIEGYESITLTLRPFLSEDSHRFIQELLHFGSTRMNMHAYDQVLEYYSSADQL